MPPEQSGTGLSDAITVAVVANNEIASIAISTSFFIVVRSFVLVNDIQ